MGRESQGQWPRKKEEGIERRDGKRKSGARKEEQSKKWALENQMAG